MEFSFESNFLYFRKAKLNSKILENVEEKTHQKYLVGYLTVKKFTSISYFLMTFAVLQFTEMMFYGIRSLHNYHNFKNFKLYFGIFKKSVFFRRKKTIFFRKNADVFFLKIPK